MHLLIWSWLGVHVVGIVIALLVYIKIIRMLYSDPFTEKYITDFLNQKADLYFDTS